MPVRYSGTISEQINAESLFDAVDKFIQRWAKLSDWNSEAIITVTDDDGNVWRVNHRDNEKLGLWRCHKHGWPTETWSAARKTS
jgi:hypothetical protein